jgi:hypothetical protein
LRVNAVWKCIASILLRWEIWSLGLNCLQNLCFRCLLGCLKPINWANSFRCFCLFFRR